MTFINSFFKLSLEELKRRTTEIIIIFIVFFITQPVFAIIDTMSYNKREYYLKSGINTYSVFNTDLLNTGSSLILYFIILYGIISALRSFSYLFSKKKTDFYHSMPIRRELYFFVKYISGIIIILIPYLINLLVAAVIVYMRTSEFLLMIVNCDFHILYFLITYSFTVLAIMLTGNAIISIITSIGISSYALLIQLIIKANISLFYITHSSYSFNSSFFEKTSMFSYLWMAISSLFEPYKMIRIYNSMGMSSFTLDNSNLDVIFILLIFLSITILSLFLFVKRPIERSGKSITFTWMERILKYAVSIPCAFLLGIILFFSIYDFKLYAAGVIAGAIIIPCILEMIYHLDVKKAFSHIYEMFIIIAASILLVIAVRYDWFKYNDYLPDEDNVESISISVNERGYSNIFGEILSDGSLNRYYATDYQLSHAEVKNNSLTYPVIKAAISDSGGISTEEWISSYTFRYRLTEGYTELHVKYKLKNGKEVFRLYYIKLDDNIDLLNNFLTNEEYYKNAYPLYKFEDYVDKINLLYVMESNQLQLNNNDRIELIRIYQEEFGALGIDYSKNDVVVGELEFISLPVSHTINTLEISSNLGLSSNNITIASYPIYSSFTNTINYIKSKGYEINGLLSDNIDSIRIFVNGNKTGYYQIYQDYTDRESIEKIIPFIQPDNYRSYNLDNNIQMPDEIQASCTYLSVEVHYSDLSEYTSYTIDCYFTDMPDFVTQDIVDLITE